MIGKLFDPEISFIEESLISKSINIFLHAISNVISKYDFNSDLFIVSINAWKTLTKLLAHTYDQKLY